MNYRFMLGILAAMLLAAGVASAAVESAAEFLDIVQQRLDSGEITADEALQLKFHYAFDRAKLPADLQPVGKAPMRCATPLVMEYQARAESMDRAIAEELGNYLSAPDNPATVFQVYESPGGRFRLNYENDPSDTDCVPLADNDASGVPDYVETVAGYLDHVFDYECNQLGFTSPPFSASYPRMSIYFYNLDGVYGFCTPVNQPPGFSRITLDNDFIGYPPNDDPDGDALGAAKVTCAHEFKHSTQYAGSRWSEDGWVEVDAVWAEEIVYPQVNDYLNYLSFNSPVSDPEMALDSGSTGTGTYEDCVWQLYQSQVHGIPIIVDLWDWRITHQSQEMMDSYEELLNQYGQTLIEAWNEFTMWNFATGARHLVGQGYYEADIYPAGSPQRTIYSYPYTYNGSVTHLAANFVRCLALDSPGNVLRVTFNGADGVDMTLSAVVNESYVTHAGAMYQIPLDANNDVVFDIPYELDGVYSVGLIPGNAEKIGSYMAYSVTVELVPFDPLAAPGDVPAFAITGNYPNPFNPSTAIKFGIDAGGVATLDIFDVAGHKVRTLLDANLGVGTHTVMWDGQDDAGRGLASGTYFARLQVGNQVTSHKLVLAK